MELGLHFSYQGMKTPWRTLFEQSLQQLELGRTIGVRTAVVAEHHFLPDGWVPSPLIACAAISGRMPDLTVGTDIVILPLYHPVRVAEDVAVLDNITGGKFVLGVALGWRKPEFTNYGVRLADRVPRLVESINIVRRLLSETGVSYRGRFFTLEDVTVMPRPLQKPHPPLWLGAIARPAVRRAAELGLTWIMPPGLDLGELKELQAMYLERLDPALRASSVGQIRPLRREAVIAATMEKAWEYARPTLDYEYGVVYREVYQDYPMGGSVKELAAYARGRFLVGTPEFVQEEIERYREALGPTHLLLRMQLPDLNHRCVMDGLELLGKVPALSRGRG